MQRRALLAGCVLCLFAVVLLAGCSPVGSKYAVIYAGNGSTAGNVPVDSQTYSAGATVTVLGNTAGLAKSHFSFANWNDQSSGGGHGYKAGNTFIMGTSDVTLYAQWTLTAPSFSAQQSFAVGTQPYSIASADFNQDGLPDLVVANSGSSSVSVLLNTTSAGSSVASFSTPTTESVGTTPYFVTTADINQDGKPDIIVADEGSNDVTVLLNTTTKGATTPTFSAQSPITVGSQPYSVVCADVNGDGTPDIIVANQAADTISVIPNTTSVGATSMSNGTVVTFAVGPVSVSSSPRTVAVADVNGDGLKDIVVTNNLQNDLSVLLNTDTTNAATPSFATAQTFLVGTAPYGLTAVDLNGDGKLDLVSTNTTDYNLGVLLNTTATGSATANFTPVASFAVGGEPFTVASADINGDGTVDLIASNSIDNTVSVLLNTTANTTTQASFANQATFAVGSTPRSVVAADINGDGKPDLVTANAGNNSISVLLNTTAP